MAKKKDDKKEDGQTRADQKIVEEACTRFKRCEDWESTARTRYLEDIRFSNADSDNGWHWPSDVKQSREAEKRPMLTVNKTRQYNLNILNEAKQNKPSIEVRPVGNRATVQGANVMEGIIRHIEYQSNAHDAYDHAGTTQVQGGIGYWRVLTEYADSETFDQDIFVRPVLNPLSVYLDPDIQQKDGSDARFGFVYDDVADDLFDVEYPGLRKKIGTQPIMNFPGWIEKDHVRVCEYYRVVRKKFKLIYMVDPETQKASIVRSDKLPKQILDPVLADPNTKTREAFDNVVEWYKIVGNEIIDRSVWLGSTVPIVRCVGEEYVVDGKYDRKGHTRGLKDPQRIYNYWTSSGVEFVALQSKVPYVGSVRAIEGVENYWQTANTQNYSVLPYNDRDDEGNEIKAPVRQEPPMMAEAYIKGMMIASEEMRMASGQYQDELGEKSQSKSGVAIFRRQQQGDIATYHFQDNKKTAVKYTGKIILELIPKIYDTPRVIKIIGEDGTESEVRLDPQAKQEYMEQKMQDQEKVKILFNPGFAKYSVQADVGPEYATRREEAFQAFTQIIGNNMELLKVAGDLMFKAADFPMADELAERLKKMVPAWVLGKGPTPEMQQLQESNQLLMKNLQQLVTQYAEERAKRTSQEGKLDIDAFNAETQRMKVLIDKFDPKVIAEFTAQLVLETLGTKLPTAEKPAVTEEPASA